MQMKIKLNRLLQKMNQKALLINTYSVDFLTIEYFGNTDLYVKNATT